MTAFAEAQCRRDPVGLNASSPRIPLQQFEGFASSLASCVSARYLGSLSTGDGQKFVFVLRDKDDAYEQWWVYTVDEDGFVIDVN